MPICLFCRNDRLPLHLSHGVIWILCIKHRIEPGSISRTSTSAINCTKKLGHSKSIYPTNVPWVLMISVLMMITVLMGRGFRITLHSASRPSSHWDTFKTSMAELVKSDIESFCLFWPEVLCHLVNTEIKFNSKFINLLLGGLNQRIQTPKQVHWSFTVQSKVELHLSKPLLTTMCNSV